MRSPEFSSAEFPPEPQPFDENSVRYEEQIECTVRDWEPLLKALRTHEAFALLASEEVELPAPRVSDAVASVGALHETVTVIESHINDIGRGGMIISEKEWQRVREALSLPEAGDRDERWGRLDHRVGFLLSEIEQRLSYLKARSERKGIIAWQLVNERTDGALREAVRQHIDSGRASSSYEIGLQSALKELSEQPVSDITPLTDGEMTSLQNEQRRAS